MNRHILVIAANANSYSIGSQDAPLTLVEYTDYQCPFCRQFHITTLACRAARCAGDQGRFWELRYVMIVNANQLKPENLLTYATDLKLDMDKFRACVESDKYRAEVDRQLAGGQAIGVSATPSFVLGRSDADKVDGIRLVGAMPYSVFDGKIKELLAKAVEK